MLERKELLVRCDVGPGELAWEDGVQFTRAQLEGDVSLVNVYARANGCHELSGAASTGELVDLATCGIDANWMESQLLGLVKKEWVLRGNCGCDVYWKRDGETRWYAATRRYTRLGPAAYFHSLRPYDVVRVEARYAVSCESLEEASALLATAARASAADFHGVLCNVASARQGGLWTSKDRKSGVADLWNVAEVVATSDPLIDTAAGLIVAGAFDVRGVHLDEAVTRSRVLVETVARTLSVDASTVIVVPIAAANDEDATALGKAPLVSDLLRAVPMSGGTNAFDATMELLSEYYAAPAPAPAEEDDATATTGLLHGESVYLGRGGDNTVKSRCEALVLRFGGAVVEDMDSPSLVILSDNHTRACDMCFRQDLQPRNRIVRERWLHRLERLAPDAELPDFRPDAVYALVRDIRNPRSYFYDADAGLTARNRDEYLRIIREDWTSSAQAGGAG